MCLLKYGNAISTTNSRKKLPRHDDLNESGNGFVVALTASTMGLVTDEREAEKVFHHFKHMFLLARDFH